jgi:hypothetical protein
MFICGLLGMLTGLPPTVTVDDPAQLTRKIAVSNTVSNRVMN